MIPWRAPAWTLGSHGNDVCRGTLHNHPGVVLVSLRHTNISDVTLAFREYEMWQGVTGIWIVRKKRKDDRVAETNEVVIG